MRDGGRQMAEMKIRIEEATAPYLREMLALGRSGDGEGLRAFLEGVPEDARRDLGYMACLLRASLRDFKQPYMGAGQDEWLRLTGMIPGAWYPIWRLGWGGAKNEIGPAYALRMESFEDRQLFYTDEDIRDHAEEAKELALAVWRESSGLAQVQVERLDRLSTLGREMPGPHWCITFRLEKKNLREVMVEGRKVCSKDPCFLLARAGEFECLMGERTGRDHGLVLIRHSYCMK